MGVLGVLGETRARKECGTDQHLLAEVFISAVCAAPMLLIFLRKQEASSLDTSWNVFGLAAAAGLGLGLLCSYFALERSQASIAVPLSASYPAISVQLC